MKSPRKAGKGPSQDVTVHVVGEEGGQSKGGSEQAWRGRADKVGLHGIADEMEGGDSLFLAGRQSTPDPHAQHGAREPADGAERRVAAAFQITNPRRKQTPTSPAGQRPIRKPQPVARGVWRRGDWPWFPAEARPEAESAEEISMVSPELVPRTSSARGSSACRPSTTRCRSRTRHRYVPAAIRRFLAHPLAALALIRPGAVPPEEDF